MRRDESPEEALNRLGVHELPPGSTGAGGKSGRTGEKPRFPLVAFDDVLMSTTSFYLVKNLIPRAGLVIVWGAPKCGKSFWTFDLLMHVACGWD